MHHAKVNFDQVVKLHDPWEDSSLAGLREILAQQEKCTKVADFVTKEPGAHACTIVSAVLTA